MPYVCGPTDRRDFDYLNESKIRCVYHDRGCEEIVQLQHLDQHEDSCRFTPAVCTNPGCGETLNMQARSYHPRKGTV